MHIGISGNSGADIYSDRCCIYELDVADALRCNVFYMPRHRFSLSQNLQGRHKTFKHKRGLSRTRYSRNNCEPSLWYIGFKGLYRVYLRCGKMYPANIKHFAAFRLRANYRLCLSRNKRPYLRLFVFTDIFKRSLGDDISAVFACLWPHFYKPVRFFKYLGVMIYQQNGISVSYKVVHNTVKSRDI